MRQVYEQELLEEEYVEVEGNLLHVYGSLLDGVVDRVVEEAEELEERLVVSAAGLLDDVEELHEGEHDRLRRVRDLFPANSQLLRHQVQGV